MTLAESWPVVWDPDARTFRAIVNVIDDLTQWADTTRVDAAEPPPGLR